MNTTMKAPVMLPVDKLRPFEGHPYKVRDDEEMAALMESISERGILTPLLVRPLEGTDEYEVVSGHRRLYAAQKIGRETLPAFVLPMDRDSAAIALVDSNLNREHLLVSEKAFAYKMKMDALRHQGTSCQVGTKSRSDEMIAEKSEDSARQVQRYIRLTNLIPELLSMMDEGKIAFSVGVELSFLNVEMQRNVLDMCRALDCTPSYSQSWHLHQCVRNGTLNEDTIFAILAKEKANQRETIKIPMKRLRDIIPENFNPQQTEDFLVKAASYYIRYLHRQRDAER